LLYLSDFNSVFEVAFAINVVLVYFELSPKIDNHFKNLICSDPGPSALQTEDGRFIEETDVFFVGTDEEKTFVCTFGWRSILFKFAKFKIILLVASLVISLFALALLITAGFLPDFKLPTFVIVLILIFLFVPVIYLTIYYFISFPKLKRYAVSEARKELNRRKKEGISIN